MGDGLEIENLSSENVLSSHSRTRSLCVSNIRNDEGDSRGLEKFDVDLKSLRRFSGCSDIAPFHAISFIDCSITSSLQDVKQHQTLQEEQDISSFCKFVGNPSTKGADTSVDVKQSWAVLEGDPEKVNMEPETVSESFFPTLKHQSSPRKKSGKTKEIIHCQQTDFNERNPKNFSNFNKGNTGFGSLITSNEETISCTVSTETNSEMQNKPKIQEKDSSKKRLSFRALVRMKGLGRKMKKKHQITKKREKYVNSRHESGQVEEFKSCSSTKYLLESSTSTSEEQTFTHMKMTRQKDTCHQYPKSLARPEESFIDHKDMFTVVENLNEYSSSENDCTTESLGRRRGAVCEELEKTLFCGEQTVADLRAILVVQQKLTGFGLL